jgi:hypothetical protein
LLLSTVYIRIAARGSAPYMRAPSLERWLGRADAKACAPDWRRQAFHLIAPESVQIPAVATAAWHASAAPGRGAWAFVATPVHLVAGMSTVSLPSDGILELEQGEADALAADFNRVWSGDGVRVHRGRGSLLLCVFDAPLEVATAVPEEAAGRDIGSALPRGADAARVRKLMSEIEMWLFEHAVNEYRRARSVAAITGLWLWGGGATDAALPAVHGWTAGNDPLFAAFAPQPRYPGAARPGVVVITEWPGTPAWRCAEESWLAPALADLKSGRLRRIDLSIGKRCFSVSARGLRRFWRKTRPWWDTLGVGEGARVDGDD